MRTPVGVFSNDVIAPKRSCTATPDSRRAGRDGGRDGLVRRAQNARAALEELNLRAERMEHGGDLHARVAAADDQHRRRHAGQLPGVAVRVRELEAGNGESSAHAAGAEDELLRLRAEARLRSRSCAGR